MAGNPTMTTFRSRHCLADYLAPLNHREANPVGAGFNLGGKRYSSRHGLKILRPASYFEGSGEDAVDLFAFLELEKLVQKQVAFFRLHLAREPNLLLQGRITPDRPGRRVFNNGGLVLAAR